jgi:16S rRNA (guanine(527)-N(7))-methyltransferase RsmG
VSASDLKPALLAGLRELGLNLSDGQVDQLLAYQDLIAKWNKVYNLTAVRDPQEMLTHHLLDSLAAIPPLLRQTGGQPGFAAGPPQGETAPEGQRAAAPSLPAQAWTARCGADSGSDPRSGAAFKSTCSVTPAKAGVHVDRAEVSSVAVDSRFRGSDGDRSGAAWGPQDRSAGPSQARSAPPGGSDPRSGGAWGPKTRLLDVGSGGGLPGVVIAITCPHIEVHCVDTVLKKATFIQQVAASLKLPNLRGIHARVESIKAEGGDGYDVVCSRAFASLVDFTSWSRSALRTGGVWMAMKGKHPADELSALPSDILVFHVEQLVVPGLDAERCIVWMRWTD